MTNLPPLDFPSRSEAGQDVWAWEQCGRKAEGIFVDIGCQTPETRNNTYAFEQIGWRGLALDAWPQSGWETRPRTQLIIADSRELDWTAALLPFGARIDYLSLDVDDATPETLEHLPLSTVRFGCITVEHDKYRVGPVPQERILATLSRYGYTRVVVDAPIVFAHGPEPFEDWYVDPGYARELRSLGST